MRLCGALFASSCAPRLRARTPKLRSMSAVGMSSAAPGSVLDRNGFKETMTVTALRVPNKQCNELMKAFRGYTLDRPRLRCIVADGDSTEHKLLLLEEGVQLAGLPESLCKRISEEALQSTTHNVVLDYHTLSYDTILRKLLPVGVEVPMSFETVGHIAHLNLREEQLPHKQVIGAVLLDKNPHIRTVVNKLGSIENEYRVFAMDVIAGEPSMETQVVQHGARFALDFSQVYWNSRLETEHTRLVTSFQTGQVVVDMMAGIGPFAIPAAQRGCTVYANDLNPRSAFYMAKNVRINKVNSMVHVFNMDGREFVKLLCATPGGPADALLAQGQDPLHQQEQPDSGHTAAGGSGMPPKSKAEVTHGSQPAAQQGAADNAAPGTGAHSGSHPAASQPHTVQSEQGDVHDPSTSGQGQGIDGGSNSGSGQAGRRAARVGREADSQPPAMPAGWRPPPQGVLWQHAVMNLPASAIEFLDAFYGAFNPDLWRGQLPMVHCYTFKRGTETEADIIAKAEHYLGGALDEPASIHTVRDVAPNKLMLCVSFRVPEAVAFATSKRAKTDAS